MSDFPEQFFPCVRWDYTFKARIHPSYSAGIGTGSGQQFTYFINV